MPLQLDLWTQYQKVLTCYSDQFGGPQNLGEFSFVI